MHQAMLIDEIFSLILHFIAEDGQQLSARLENTSDIARLARTCRCFMQRALDTLWRTQHSLSPLIMCLPAHTWEIQPTNILCLTELPNESDWTRFDVYSRRVKRFSYPKKRNIIGVHDDALPLLLAKRHPQSLFPSLSSLDFSILSCSSSNFPLIKGFLSPNLTNISFTIPRNMSPRGISEVLEDLPKKATHLEHISISSFILATSFELKFPTHGLPRLMHLAVSNAIRISAESILNIASFRYVQGIALNLHPDFDADLLCSVAKNTFPALQRLSLTAVNLSQCTSLVSLISSSRLDELSVSYDVQATPSTVTSFLSAVGTSLRSISLRHHISLNTTADAPFIFHSSTFAPLLACRNLRCIKVYNLGRLSLDDEFIIAAANSWTKLEELRLCSLPWELTIPSITLNSLTALTQHCRRLTHVHLSLDARDVPELPMDSLRIVGAQFLEVLNIRDSAIVHIEPVALFLRTIMPNIKVLYVEAHPELRDKWMEVKACYDQLRVEPLPDGPCEDV